MRTAAESVLLLMILLEGPAIFASYFVNLQSVYVV
jgi:hypothetical protein